jgi:soluble P-type ATPase
VLAFGNAALMRDAGANSDALAAEADTLRRSGKTVMFLAVDGALAGAIAVGDKVKESTVPALAALRADGLHIVMLTGDARGTAQAVARQLGIDEVFAEVQPADKAHNVARLQAADAAWRMVGDGINDAPALARANVGIAMGTGTDIAMESAAVTLVSGDLNGIVNARRLSRATVRNIWQNLVFAFGYNALGIPVAAGVLYPIHRPAVVTRAGSARHEPVVDLGDHQRACDCGDNEPMLTRRRFVQGMGGGVLLSPAACRCWVTRARLLNWSDRLRPHRRTMPVNFTGAARNAVAVNGQVPGRTLRMRQGDDVTIRVTNKLREQTSIHWHGIILPADMDGVPGLSFNGIAPGTTFTYRFKVNQSGTYWYHSHSRFQEQVGLYGPIVVERRGGERHGADREHTSAVLGLDGSRPRTHLRHAQASKRLLQLQQAHVQRLLADVRKQGFLRRRRDRRMWGAMRMNPTTSPTSAATRTPIY